MQPLRRERLAEPPGPRVGQHAVGLPLQLALIAEPPLFGRREELIVGHRAPEQRRQPAGQFPIVEPVSLDVFVTFGQKQKTLGTEDREHPGLDGIGKRRTGVELRLYEGDVAIEFVRRHRPAKRPPREPLEPRANLFEIPRLGRPILVPPQLLLRADQRPAPGDPIQDQERIPRPALFVGQLHLPGRAGVFCADEGDVAVIARPEIVGRPRNVVDDVDRGIPLGEMGLKRDRDRTVFGGDDILGEEHAIDGRLDDLQSRGTAVVGFQAAERVADLVDARCRQGLNQGVAINVARPHLEPHLVEQAGLPQPCEMGLVDRILGHGPAGDLEERGLLFRIGLGQDRLGGGEIFFDRGGGEREHRSQPLEPVPFRILGEAGRIGGVEMHAEEIADGVDILVAGQPVVRHAAALRQPRRLALLESRCQPRHDRSGVVRRRRPRHVLRRHLARGHPPDHLGPLRSVLSADLAGKGIDPKPAFLLLVAVAAKAVGLEVGPRIRLEVRSGPNRGRRHPDGQADEAADRGWFHRFGHDRLRNENPQEVGEQVCRFVPPF